MNHLDRKDNSTTNNAASNKKPWTVPQIETLGDVVDETKGPGDGTTDVLIGGSGGFEFGGGMS